MKKNNFRWVWSFFLLGVFLLGGCPGTMAPGTTAYKPLPQWEAGFYSKARRDVFPDDVRRLPEQYGKSLVVWTGIIRNIEHQADANSDIAYFSVEHHYFDWIEDHSIQRQKYFLSPRGEGTFIVAWRVQNPAEVAFINQFHVGDMLIAYGNPAISDGKIGLFPTMNLRAIDARSFRTDILDYGRPGEPTKVLKVAF